MEACHSCVLPGILKLLAGDIGSIEELELAKINIYFALNFMVMLLFPVIAIEDVTQTK